MDADRLHPCAKPDCFRLVSPGSSFCCGNCAGANGGLYELDPYQSDLSRDPYSMHTATCEARHRERGPWRDPFLSPEIIRPWAGCGDNWEILASPPPDLRGLLPEPGSPEEAKMVRNYIRNRYGHGGIR